MPDVSMDPIQDNLVPSRLQALLQDYKAKESIEESGNRLIVQITGIGFALFGALVTYVFPKGGEYPQLLFWFLPLSVSVPYALCFQLIFKGIFTGYYLRDVENEIASYTKISFFHYHYASARAIYSPKTGLFSMHVLYFLIVFATAGLYAVLVGFGYSNLQSASYFHASEKVWFLLLHGLVMLAMLVVLAIAFSSMKTLYERWKKGELDKDVPDPTVGLKSLFIYFLFPRPLDLVFKEMVFWGVVLVAAFASHLSLGANLVWISIAVFVCVDVLAKQTTYIWNDIIDFDRDSSHPHKRLRPLPRLGTRHIGKVCFFMRLGVTFVASFAVAIAFALWWLPVLTTIIMAWQFVYDRWGKERPLRKLVICSVGYIERAIAGLLVVSHISGSYNPALFFLILLWVATSSAAFLSAYWKAEEEFLVKRGHPRETSWFMTTGQKVTLPATVLLLPLGSALAALLGDLDTNESLLILSLGCIFISGALAVVWKVINVKNRGIFAAVVLSASVLAWLGLEEARWIVLALGVPLLVGVIYANESYEEAHFLYIKDLIKTAFARLDHFLFE